MGVEGSVTLFLGQVGLENFNLLKVCRYVSDAQLSKKLNGFVEKENERREKDVFKQKSKGKTASVPSAGSGGVVQLQALQTFLECLLQSDQDGKLIVDKDDTASPYLRYILLNPSSIFQEITCQARAVIMTGGTMEPLAEVKQQLFPDLAPARFAHFSCGHIVAKENIGVVVVGKGIKKELKFDYEMRSDVDLLGLMMVNYCRVIPAGIVLFFPSYTYMQVITDLWTTRGIISKIEMSKRVFWERKGCSADDILRDYAKGVENGGALIMCVVGGKLSEGINFSDNLARAVFMIGMPFGNLGSLELQEKIRYHAALKDGKSYYENLCMKSVNQCIGRAIRHRHDYAMVFLMDVRYAGTRVQGKLPGWIRESGVKNLNFQESLQEAVKV